MKRIAILGAGGQAREIAWLIRDINRDHPSYEFAGYIVRDLSRLCETDSREDIAGDESWLERNRQKIDCLAIGIGTPSVRIEVGDRLSERFPELTWPALVHPRSVLDSQTCNIGPGVLICAGSICTTNITFGQFAVANFGSTVGHDTRLGRGCVVNPGANLAGGVVLGEGVLVGTGAQILQYRRVGAGATVGAGSVVTRDVPADTVVLGIPARPMQRP